jgi:glutamate synthase domain-containing protein 3
MSFAAGMEVGNVFVQTTSNRGYTAEEIAERAVNRLRRIETEEELKRVLTKYLQEAQDSERMNARRTLVENGFIDAASHLGD